MKVHILESLNSLRTPGPSYKASASALQSTSDLHTNHLYNARNLGFNLFILFLDVFISHIGGSSYIQSGLPFIGSLHFQYWKGKRVEASHSYHSTKSRSNLLFCWLPLYMSGPLIMAGLHWNQRKLTFSPQRSLSSWTVAMGLAPNHLAVMKTLKWLQGVQKIIWLWWKFEMTARVTKHNLAQYRP